MTQLPKSPFTQTQLNYDLPQAAPPWGIAQSPLKSAGTPSGGLTQQLPEPPPSVKRANPFDKEHLSETLLGIAQGFLSNQDFGAGLGAAAGSIGDRMKAIRAENTKSVALGGPDNSFEVVTDPKTGQRTYRPVEAFQKYATDKYNREHAPTRKETLETASSGMAAIMALPPEQRPAAAAALKARMREQGHDVGNLPDAENYSDQAATFVRDMGVPTVAQDRRERDDKRDAATAAYREAGLGIRKAQLGISQNREARAATKSTLPMAPPKSARAKLPAGFILD